MIDSKPDLGLGREVGSIGWSSADSHLGVVGRFWCGAKRQQARNENLTKKASRVLKSKAAHFRGAKTSLKGQEGVDEQQLSSDLRE